MLKTLRAGAFALAVAGLSSATNVVAVTPANAQDPIVSESRIARLKHTLHLTAAQQQYWRPVEAAMRSMLRKRRREESADGAVERVHAKASDFTVNVATAQRIATLARPLINSLDEEQKRAGLSAIRAMGVASLF